MNLFELAAVLTLNKSSYDKGIKDAEKSAESMGSKVGTGLKAAGAMATKIVAAGATAVGALVKQSVSAYGEYEQLKGGIEALFGESSDIIMNYSKKAFSNAQISANEYMSTITSFSGAILKSASDSKQAAELSNMAVIDMADQANRYGKTVQEVSQTYTSLARGNFQTLDNLFGGMFAGTKTGLREMLDYAENYRASLGETVEYSESSYADIVQAIHDVSKAMNVEGTSIDEAGSTIQGSFNAAKAAWQDLVTGLANPDADIGELASNVISQATGAVKNMLPVIQRALSGIGPMVKELIPSVVETAVGLINDNLPMLIDAAVLLVTEIGSAIGENVQPIVDAALHLVDMFIAYLDDPNGLLKLVDVAIQIIEKLADGLTAALPTLVPAIVKIIVSLAEKLTDPEMIGTLVDSAIALVEALAEGLLSSIDILLDAVIPLVIRLGEALVKEAPKLLKAAISLVGRVKIGILRILGQKIGEIATKIGQWIKEKIVDPIANFLSDIWSKIEEFFQPLIDFVQPIFEAFGNLFFAVFENIRTTVSGWASDVWDKITGIWDSIKTWLHDNILDPIAGWFSTAFNKIYDKVKEPLDKVKNFIKNTFNSIKTFITDFVSNAWTWGKNLIDGFWQGLLGKRDQLVDGVNDLTGKIKDDTAGKKGFDTHSPSRWAQKVFENVLKGAKVGLNSGENSLLRTTEGIVSGVQDRFDNSFTASYTPTSSQGGSVYALLAQYLPMLAQLKVYLDTGVLVGELTPGVDAALGQRKAYAIRGNA